jgi:hypothetical protein
LGKIICDSEILRHKEKLTGISSCHSDDYEESMFWDITACNAEILLRNSRHYMAEEVLGKEHKLGKTLTAVWMTW